MSSFSEMLTVVVFRITCPHTELAMLGTEMLSDIVQGTSSLYSVSVADFLSCVLKYICSPINVNTSEVLACGQRLLWAG